MTDHDALFERVEACRQLRLAEGLTIIDLPDLRALLALARQAAQPDQCADLVAALEEIARVGQILAPGGDPQQWFRGKARAALAKHRAAHAAKP